MRKATEKKLYDRNYSTRKNYGHKWTVIIISIIFYS